MCVCVCACVQARDWPWPQNHHPPLPRGQDSRPRFKETPHTRIYIYVSMLGYLELFVCVCVCLWSVSGTAIYESCSSFHSWLHEAERTPLWCQKQWGEEIKKQEKIGGKREEHRTLMGYLFSLLSPRLSVACWVKTQLWVLWDHVGCFICLVAVSGCYLKIKVSCLLLECVFLRLSGWCGGVR